MDAPAGYLSAKEFAAKIDYSNQGIRSRLKAGKFKKFKIIKNKGGSNNYFIHESELLNFNKKETPEPELHLTADDGEWLSVDDFTTKSGRSRDYIQKMLQGGRLKNTKKVKTASGAGFKWFVNKSELERFKGMLPTRKLGPRNSTMHKFNDVPKIDEVVDVSLDLIADFVPETGKFPYKNLCMAVSMAIQRDSWEAIEDLTGVPQKQVVMLIDEYKEAAKREPKKYPSLMAYLNAGRPYNPRNRDYLKEGE